MDKLLQCEFLLDFFHSFEVISDDDIEGVGDGLVFFVVGVVSLSVEEPNWDSVSNWVFDDLEQFLLLLGGQLTGSVSLQSRWMQRMRKGKGNTSCGGRLWRSCRS